MEMIRCPGCMKQIPAGTTCEYCGYDSQTDNAAHQLAVGTILKEQYQIGRALGQGGFGITYLGWDLYLDIPVAIKEYYPSGTVMRENAVTMSVTDVSGDDGTRFRNNRDRFMREAKMLARFSQVPEIVQVRNFFLANNTAYIVMEYVEGITLKQYVKDQGGRLTVAETLEILGPMIRTLDKVHRTGIIHRDISPDNIMMIPGGAKLLDFGAVRSVSSSVGQELTRSTEAILKQGYAPIEQYQKRGALGPWTDVYALCATICYCLTGEVPPDAPARMLDYENVDLSSIPGLTTAQRQALEHGMALRADERTASMEQLHHELFSMEPLSDPEPEPEPEPKSVHEPKPEPKPVTRPETKPVTKLEPKPEPEPKLEPKPEPKKTDAGKNSNFWLILGVAVLAVVLVVGAMLLDRKKPEAEGSPAVQVSENQITGECGIDCRWVLDLDTGVMTLTGSLMGNFYLEEYDAGMREGSAPQPWAEYRDSIREVVLDGDFVRVGTAAFARCTNLSKVTFNDKLWEIGMDAFWNTGLTEIQLPESLRYIEAYAFSETPLREVVIPLQVDSIGREGFALCPHLIRVELKGSTSWNLDIHSGKPVFCQDGYNVDAITLCGPEGGIVELYADALGYRYQSNGNQVKFEGEGDFSDYPGNAQGSWRFDSESGLLYIQGEMPTDMLGQWEMDNNHPERMQGREDLRMAPWWKYRDQLRVVYIAEGVTRICDNAFANMQRVRSIYLPDSLRSIGFQSFLDSGLEEVYIPDSVTEIRDYAFNYCQSLVTARLPMGLVKLEQGVFNACPMLTYVYAGNQTEFCNYEDDGYPVTPFTNIPSDGHLDETAFPEDLILCTPLGQQGAYVSGVKAFAEEFGLTYRTGVYGHENAEVTGEMLVGDSSLYWALENGTLYLMGRGETPYYRSGNIDRNAWHTMQQGYRTISNEAPWYPYRNEIHTVIVEPGITVLNRGILVNMPNLEHVDLGTVEKLYDGAIENCGITQLNLPDSLVHVHKGAIRDCIELKVIHIGSGSEKLDHGMIQGCSNLQELWFWSGKEKIHEAFDLFDGNTPRDLVIHARHDSEGSYYAQRSDIAYEKIP